MIEQIIQRIGKRQHVLVTGSRGMGKTWTLAQVMARLDADTTIRLSGGTARKALVTQLLQRCWDDEHDIGLDEDHEEWSGCQKEMRGEGVDELLARCTEYLKLYTFVVDDFALMTARTCGDIMPHLLSGIVIAAADVSSAMQRKRIASAINSFQRMELEPLSKEQTVSLLWSLTDRDQQRRPRQLETTAWNQSRGVPGVVAELVDQLGESGSMRDVQELHHDAPAVRMIGLLPALLMIAMVVVIVMRVTTRGMNDPISYGLTMAAYPVFRLIMRPLQNYADG